MKKILALVLAVMLLVLAGCGEQKQENVKLDMTKIYGDFEKTLPKMTKLDENRMLDFCGIKIADCVQAEVYVCSDGLRADEIWLIEAKDTAALDAIEKLANNRLQRKGEESVTYSPQQYEVVQKAQIIRSGNNLALIVSPDVDALAQLYRAAAGLG